MVGGKRMNEEIRKYFLEKYFAQDMRVVPGHNPDFKSKEEVDEWIKTLETIKDFSIKIFEEE